ncbi:MAG TPA: hypothetical protein VFG68_19290 [Fimbriiglobus sp.]|nr:hypothetical protein [Fimbriiglobus sp.]
MASVIPIAKAIYICDELVPDPARNKLLIVGACNAVRLPADASFPYTLGKLCVFAQLVSGVGQVAMRLDIVRAVTRDVIYSSGPRHLSFPGRHTTLTFSLRLRQFVFPAPGGYWVELFCQDQFLDDRLIHVLV